jgi:hypothetical protein
MLAAIDCESSWGGVRAYRQDDVESMADDTKKARHMDVSACHFPVRTFTSKSHNKEVPVWWQAPLGIKLSYCCTLIQVFKVQIFPM